MKIKNNDYLILFEDCRLVKGFRNAIIYDLTRPNNSNFIPFSLIDFIEKSKNNPLIEILRDESIESKNIMLEYVEFLIENEFAFLGDLHIKESLSEIDFNIEIEPSTIYDSIICLNENNLKNVLELIEILDELFCQHIEFRIEVDNSNFINEVINKLNLTTIKSVELRIKYFNGIIEFVQNILKKEPRVREVFIYNAPESNKLNQISIYKQNVDFINDCGVIEKSNFNVSLKFFTNSKSCNTCLNKKLSIDFDSNVKNCPSSKNSFGNFSKREIKDLVKTSEFKKLGEITKDMISICKDCEYRYMCQDCRVYIESNSIYSKPIKCGYNPYIGKWKDERGFVEVSECGTYNEYDLFIPDVTKIENINKVLWRDE